MISSGSHWRHGGNESVFGHDGFQFFEIGRAAGIHDGCRLLEVIWTDERGSNDGQRLRIGLLQVVETMNISTRNKTRLARANVNRSSLHSKRDHAFDSVDGLVVMPVRMGQRHLRTDRDG